MAAYLPVRITNAGYNAFINAKSTGVNLDLTHIQIGDGNRLIDRTETALVSPVMSAPILFGERITLKQIRMATQFVSAEGYNFSEVGIWSGEPDKPGSTLFAVFALEEGILASISPNFNLIFEHDMVFDEAVAGNITVVINQDAANWFLTILQANKPKMGMQMYYFGQI